VGESEANPSERRFAQIRRQQLQAVDTTLRKPVGERKTPASGGQQGLANEWRGILLASIWLSSPLN
jgi:hypothetical protein